MDPITIATIGILLMFLLIIMHVPIGISMAIIGVLGFGIISSFNASLTILSAECVTTLSNADLAVVPLFLLMGNFASEGGISKEIYDLSYAHVGHRRGGLALSTILGCSFFGAICGSSPATAATFGRVALPEMLKRRYSSTFAAGCIAAGGTLAAIVPPSVIMIIYAVMAEQFILDMFTAGGIPALLQIAMYLIAVYVYVRLRPEAGPKGPRVAWADRIKKFRECWRPVIIGLTVIGGIYGGVFTVNEAAAFGAVLSFAFVLISGELTWKKFWSALEETANTTAMIYIIIIGANVFSYFVTISRMPEAVISIISQLSVPNFVILILLTLIYLILGSIFDTVAALLITLPFVLPLILSMGYDPIWWGIVNVVIMETGMITPPIGMNVFVLHGVTRLPLGVIYRGTIPFLIADFIRIVLIIVFPCLSLWLPGVLR